MPLWPLKLQVRIGDFKVPVPEFPGIGKGAVEISMDGFNQGLHHCIVGIHFAAAQLLVLGLLVELRLINQQGVNLNDA